MNNDTQIKELMVLHSDAELNAIQDELLDAWQKNQIFRTETEARNAVLNDLKFPTNASKYWQSIREQMVHFSEAMMLSFDIKRKKIDLAEVQGKLFRDREGVDKLSNFERQRLEVDRDEYQFEIASMEPIAKDRVREVLMWSQFKKEFNDGSFDDKNVNTHQKESLFRSILNRANNADPKQLSPEERMSIQGVLNMLKDEPVNKKFIESLQKKVSNG